MQTLGILGLVSLYIVIQVFRDLRREERMMGLLGIVCLALLLTGLQLGSGAVMIEIEPPPAAER